MVIGAYGHFGSLICKYLKEIPGVEVIGMGRKASKLHSLGEKLGIETITLDYRDNALSRTIVDNNIHMVIHAAGPFQGQDITVAEACIAAGCYYADIADDKDFISAIYEINVAAEQADVMVASGLGLTALNMAIIDKFSTTIKTIEHVSLGHSGSGRIPGQASLESLLSSAGREVHQIEGRRITPYHGLRGRSFRFFSDSFIRRDLVTADSPDMDLVKVWNNPLTFRYKVGLGFACQKTLSLISGFARINWIKNPKKWVSTLRFIGKSQSFLSKGRGALFADIEGRSGNKEVSVIFEIHSTDHQFEFLKIVPVIVLVKRLMNNYIPFSGSRPGIDLMGFDDIEKELDKKHFRIIEKVG